MIPILRNVVITKKCRFCDENNPQIGHTWCVRDMQNAFFKRSTVFNK